MRRLAHDQNGKPFFKQISWSDHRHSCAKCQSVDLQRSATFALACAEGSPLLAEELVKMQMPAQQEKERVVREWAKKAGVFKDA